MGQLAKFSSGKSQWSLRQALNVGIVNFACTKRSSCDFVLHAKVGQDEIKLYFTHVCARAASRQIDIVDSSKSNSPGDPFVHLSSRCSASSA